MRITFHRSTRSFAVDSAIVPLTRKETDFAEFLLMRGEGATREEILAYLYGTAAQPEQKILDVFICKIRRKFRNLGAPNAIATQWGRGYRLNVD
jgi:two-component system cell cycle response regulator CtrA